MKIYRPLWEDGAFLMPQQFQQQAAWDVHLADSVARMGLAHPWGVVAAEFDDSLLPLSRLNATRLIVRFPDGTLIDTERADNLPPVCDLSTVSDRSLVDIVLALPLLNANGGNLDDGSESERPRRWKSERVNVQELAGHEKSEVAVLRHNLTLRMAHQENAAWLTCPVTRLVRDAQGQWCRDPRFIPPLLTLSASPSLMTELAELLHHLQARRQRLMSMRRENNARLSGRTENAVKLRARELGVKFTGNGRLRLWTAEEWNVLSGNMALGPSALMKLLPGRSRRSVQGAMRRLQKMMERN